MMDIDWSKAPEGATHYREDWHCTSTGGVQYYKKSEGGWEYWGELLGPGWRECGEPVLGFKEIPNKVINQRIWKGEGPPPVGTVCEHQLFGCEGWSKATVLAYGEKKTFYRDRDGHEWSRLSDEIKFRPIRTAEQISAEGRETAIDEMVRIALHQSYVITPSQAKIVFERLYDANYRKQVTP